MQNRIHLTGDDAGSLKRVREQGIEGIWNDKFSLSDSTGSYAIRFDVQFVGTGNQHYDVNVSNSYGRCDMLNWCTRTDWGPDYQDELAAHEFGHMIGAFHEYAGGATYDNFAATGTIMSDLTAALRPNFMNPIDHHAEQFTGRTFEWQGWQRPAVRWRWTGPHRRFQRRAERPHPDRVHHALTPGFGRHGQRAAGLRGGDRLTLAGIAPPQVSSSLFTYS